MTAQERAEYTLLHYFRVIAKKAGLPWDHDNDVEIRSIVTDLLDASKEAGVR